MSSKVILLIALGYIFIAFVSAVVFIAIYIHKKDKEVDLNKILPLYKRDAKRIVIGMYGDNNFYVDKGQTLINPYDYVTKKTIYIDKTLKLAFIYDFNEDEYCAIARIGGDTDEKE